MNQTDTTVLIYRDKSKGRIAADAVFEMCKELNGYAMYYGGIGKDKRIPEIFQNKENAAIIIEKTNGSGKYKIEVMA